MFCHKCGYKLTSGNNQCSNCGTTHRNLEVCGGFWGLVGEEKRQVSNVTQNISQPNENGIDAKVVEKLNSLEYVVENTAKKQVVLTYISFGLMILIVVALIFSNIFLLSKLDKTNENEQQFVLESEGESQSINQVESESITIETTKVKETKAETTEASTTEEATTEEPTTEEPTTEEPTTEEPTTEETTTEEPTTETESTSGRDVKGD